MAESKAASRWTKVKGYVYVAGDDVSEEESHRRVKQTIKRRTSGSLTSKLSVRTSKILPSGVLGGSPKPETHNDDGSPKPESMRIYINIGGVDALKPAAIDSSGFQMQVTGRFLERDSSDGEGRRESKLGGEGRRESKKPGSPTKAATAAAAAAAGHCEAKDGDSSSQNASLELSSVRSSSNEHGSGYHGDGGDHGDVSAPPEFLTKEIDSDGAMNFQIFNQTFQVRVPLPPPSALVLDVWVTPPDETAHQAGGGTGAANNGEEPSTNGAGGNADGVVQSAPSGIRDIGDSGGSGEHAPGGGALSALEAEGSGASASGGALKRAPPQAGQQPAVTTAASAQASKWAARVRVACVRIELGDKLLHVHWKEDIKLLDVTSFALDDVAAQVM